MDPFAGRPLSLVRRDNEVRIYSIGPNMIDDNGLTNEDDSDADDIMVKLTR